MFGKKNEAFSKQPSLLIFPQQNLLPLSIMNKVHEFENSSYSFHWGIPKNNIMCLKELVQLTFIKQSSTDYLLTGSLMLWGRHHPGILKLKCVLPWMHTVHDFKTEISASSC